MSTLDAATDSKVEAGVAVTRATDPQNDRREQVGWCFYDWANSVFPTTVVLVLGPYLVTVAGKAADADGFIYPLGVPLRAGAFWAAVLTIAALFQVVCLPILGAVADYSRRRKQMLGLFAMVGAFLTVGLVLVEGANYLLGGLLFVFANLSYGASIVIYNAYLPDVAAPDRRDTMSSRGWALGYLGGGLLLAANLYLFTQAESLGIAQADAVRINILSAGLWWALFTLIPLATLRNHQPARSLPPGERYLTVGFRQLRQSLARVRNYPQTLLFLLAFLIYNDGIQAVLSQATVFGQEELRLDMSTLTGAILLVQFVGIFGALAFGRLAKAIGSRRAIMISLVIWSGAMVFAFGFLRTTDHFFILAAVIAVVFGGSQALSRSLFSQMIPKGQEAEYFSVYEISDKGTSWLAPLLFLLTYQLTESYRFAIVSLIVFFVLGLALLSRVNVRKAALAVGNEAPERA